MIVARSLAFDACLAIGPPHRGMKPPDELRCQLQTAGQRVKAAQVDQLIAELKAASSGA